MPAEIQLSSVNAIKIFDINQDNYPDFIAAGNCFDLLPQFCRVDASYGHVLLNDKRGNLIVKSVVNTGIDLKGQVRDIVTLKYKKDNYFIFLQNNDYPVMYKLN